MLVGAGHRHNSERKRLLHSLSLWCKVVSFEEWCSLKHFISFQCSVVDLFCFLQDLMDKGTAFFYYKGVFVCKFIMSCWLWREACRTTSLGLSFLKGAWHIPGLESGIIGMIGSCPWCWSPSRLTNFRPWKWRR